MTAFDPSAPLPERPAFEVPPLNGGTYELKFVLRDEQVAPISEWASQNLDADPHSGQYEVNSLYFDDEAFSVYHRRPGFRRSKYRVRRYGSEDLLYLEEKRKVRGWVQKRRTSIPFDVLSKLNAPLPERAEMAWFQDVVQAQMLAPRCQIGYQRLARIGEAEGSTVRLTLDQGVRCRPTRDFAIIQLDPKDSVQIGRNILELKFKGGLPLLYKDLIREFSLGADRSSKYRLSVWLSGLAPAVQPAGGA